MATTSSITPDTTTRPVARRGPLSQHRLRWGYFFLLPWAVSFLAFQLLPIVSTVFLSFTDYSATREFALGNFDFVGLSNYGRLFTDPQLIDSMGVTLKFALISLPVGLAVPLMFAVLVNSKYLMAANVFRTLIYVPTIIPVVAGAMVFQGLLNADSGWLNGLLGIFGISGPRWLSDPAWAVPALVLLGLLGAGNAMLIYLGALQSVPTEMYEAASLDGANWIHQFFVITLPMISPIIFYNVTLGLIAAFQYFVPALLLGGRNGEPQGAMLFYNLHFYRQAFVFNDMGYASVLALLLFLVVMVFTILLFRFGQQGVYYAGDDF